MIIFEDKSVNKFKRAICEKLKKTHNYVKVDVRVVPSGVVPGVRKLSLFQLAAVNNNIKSAENNEIFEVHNNNEIFEVHNIYECSDCGHTKIDIDKIELNKIENTDKYE